CNVLWGTKAQSFAEECRHCFAPLISFDSFLEVRDCLGHVRCSFRNDGVDGHAGALHLKCPSAHHTYDAGLGCRVVALTKVSSLASRRTNCDDTTCNSIFFEIAKSGTHASKCSLEVDVDNGVKVFVSHL